MKTTNKRRFKLVMSHPTGNANVRAAAAGLFNAGILKEFHTTIASFPGNIYDQLSKIGPLSEFGRRRYDPALAGITDSWPWWELGRMVALKSGMKGLAKHGSGVLSVDKVYQKQDQRTASLLEVSKRTGLNGIYAYEDGAIQAFGAAKDLGLKCFYDLPIGYWRRAEELLQPELERWPEWSPTLIGFQDSEEKRFQKDEELRLADQIFVASSFTASTLSRFQGKLGPVQVIPYGFPTVATDRTYEPVANRKLKLLFVGSLSQRKGIADLFAAVKNIGKSIELTVVGSKTNAACPALDAALREHTWIPGLAHEEILKLMKSQDVLVFPSLFEGFGLVITEAMSQGTPVITTERTAGPDLIVHDQNGWIIEAGSTNAIQAQILKLLERPGMIKDAGIEAMETAKKRTWQHYGQELSEAIIKSI